MKRIFCGATLALLVVTFALPALSFAGAYGPSATGTFQFTLEDGQTRFLEFNARQQNNGRVVGAMTFSDPNVVPVDWSRSLLVSGRRARRRQYPGPAVKTSR